MTSVSVPNSEVILSPHPPTTLTYSSNLTDGGYDYELLGGTDSRYECPICLLYLRDPVLTTCGHRFCSGCIEQWVVKEGGKCPVDGVNLSHENIFPDNYTRREIMQCKAKCPYVKDGCFTILSLAELERHIEIQHVVANISPGSSKRNNNSPSSSSIGTVDCLYKEVGCAGYFPPEQLQRHLELDVHHHLQLLTAAYKRLKVFSSRPTLDFPSPLPEQFLRQDSRESARWLLGDETLESDDYQFRRQRSWDSVRFARQSQYYCRPRYPDRLAESDESLCNKSEPFKDGAKGADDGHSTPKNSILKSSGSADFKDVYERLVRLEQTDREKQIKIDQLELRLTSAMNLNSNVTRLMDDITARYCHGVFVWKIPRFKATCLDWMGNRTRYGQSPGFYTNSFGYKLNMRAHLTTRPSETGAAVPVDLPLEHDEYTFISLNIHFMKGEFDDTLVWPFRGEIKISIVHPTKPESLMTDTLISKPDVPAFAKPTLPRNPTGMGFQYFCSLSNLFSSGFVKDDTLVCKVLAKPE